MKSAVEKEGEKKETKNSQSVTSSDLLWERKIDEKEVPSSSGRGTTSKYLGDYRGCSLLKPSASAQANH